MSYHNLEQMLLYLCIVDKVCNIHEEFLECVALKKVAVFAKATTILGKLDKWQLPLEDMRDQGFDGAKSMSSDRVECQAILRQPSAVHTHCSSHFFNLIVVGAIKLSSVHDAIKLIKEIGLFFNSSLKCESQLVEVINNSLPFSE